MARFRAIQEESLISCYDVTDGERIEDVISKMIENNEPIANKISGIAEIESDGTMVLPECDIRTDRWEIALEAIDKIEKYKEAKVKNLGLPKEKPEIVEEQGGGGGYNEPRN